VRAAFGVRGFRREKPLECQCRGTVAGHWRPGARALVSCLTSIRGACQCAAVRSAVAAAPRLTRRRVASGSAVLTRNSCSGCRHHVGRGAAAGPWPRRRHPSQRVRATCGRAQLGGRASPLLPGHLRDELGGPASESARPAAGKRPSGPRVRVRSELKRHWRSHAGGPISPGCPGRLGRTRRRHAPSGGATGRHRRTRSGRAPGGA
jgi:hypothetical protein